MATTKIEWTDKTWNPVVGCSHASPGCSNCYAENMAARHVLMQQALKKRSPYLRVVDARARQWTRPVDAKRDPDTYRIVELLPARLAEALSFPAGSKVFVVSMGDLFHAEVPFEYIAAVFGVMAARPTVTFQVLTKRPGRMLEFFGWLSARSPSPVSYCFEQAIEFLLSAREQCAAGVITDAREPAWPLPNVWLGTSVEDQERADERIWRLMLAPAAARFLSVEPLLEDVDLGLCKVTCSCCHKHRGQGRWVRLRHAVSPDFAFLSGSGRPAAAGIYRAESNPHGALSVRREGGSLLGIKPGEFEFLPQPDLVIVGGESGHRARPLQVEWVRSIRRQCSLGGVALFVKQLGANVLDRNDQGFDGDDDHEWPAETCISDDIGRFQGDLVRINLCDRKGGNPAEWPADLRVRQFPEVQHAG